MLDQTQSGLAANRQAGLSRRIARADRELLRHLAGQVAELGNLPAQATRRERWRQHNDLRLRRPLVFCDPENGWSEIITAEDLRCRGELARHWELTLRKEIFWGTRMGDDRAVEPVFDIPCVYSESDWGMHEDVIRGESGGAYRWNAPLRDYAEMGKLRFPVITVDASATLEMLDLAQAIMGGCLEVRPRTRWWWTLGLTWTLVKLRGLETMLYDMLDHPRQLKQLMAFLRDGHLAMLDFLEADGLLAANHDGSYVGSGGFGYTRELPQPGSDPSRVRTLDMWGFCESQETTMVSPEMFAEFILPYQLPILERFGLNCYGCCEPLEKRWNYLRQIPRLRRVSVSPWADLERMAEYLGDRYLLSYKPHPAMLASPQIDEGAIRSGLRLALELTRGCVVEIIMKDNHTLGGNPDNAVRWCRIAREEIAAMYGAE